MVGCFWKWLRNLAATFRKIEMTEIQPEEDTGVENFAKLEGAENKLSSGMCWGV